MKFGYVYNVYSLISTDNRGNNDKWKEQKEMTQNGEDK